MCKKNHISIIFVFRNVDNTLNIQQVVIRLQTLKNNKTILVLTTILIHLFLIEMFEDYFPHHETENYK